VHAGWRGTVARIAIKTIQAMVSAYNSDPLQLKAIIGPGISRKNFEVGQEVYDAFQQAMFPMDKIAVMQEKWHIDLPLCNRLQLESTGIPSENIHDCGICTYDHADDYFSARRLSINSGRIYTGIVLRH
jgi:YfiH family protein